MRLFQNRLKTVSALTTVLVMLLSILCGGVNLNAATAGELTSITDSLSVTELKNGTVDLLTDTTATVTYGDTLLVTMKWTLPNGLAIAQGDDYTYTLPDNISFSDTSGELSDGSRDLGTFKIESNVIKICYTDAGFCGPNEQDRQGQLTFSGTLQHDGNGDQPEGPITVTFPVGIDITLNAKKPTQNPTVDVFKQFVDPFLPNANPDHIYDCVAEIKSIGANTNVVIDDDMWPGMWLIGSPKFYTDASCTIPLDQSRYTDYTSAPSTTNRYVDAKINSMSSGEKIYLKYRVQVEDKLYNPDTAVPLMENERNLYPYNYQGNVPNRIIVNSTEDPEGEMAWADIITYKAFFGKWTHPILDDFEHGLTGWQFAIYSLDNTRDFSRGYVLDTLPSATSLVEDSVEVTIGGVVLPNAVSISYTKDENQVDVVMFLFSEALMTKLKEGNNAWISYQIKVDKQDPKTALLINRAAIYYDGVKRAETGSDVNYTKPEELKKGVAYDAATAPYANYEITVNPAALDLVDNTDDLKLVDTMSSSYDLKVSSVRINGKEPATDEFSYEQSTRTITFNLKDKTTYKITYSAAVNLVPGSQLTDNNSGNSATLYAETTVLKATESKLNCVVYQSAGSSSSTITGLLNIIKHEKGDTSKFISGAGFTLTEMSVDSSGKATATSTTKTGTTDANGAVSFGGLTRGTVYMLSETTAPSGYAKDTEVYFYAFEGTSGSVPTTVTYNDKSYSVNVVPSTKISTDIYFPNEVETVTPSPATTSEETTTTPTPSPSTTTTTPTPDPLGGDSGNSGNGTGDEGKGRAIGQTDTDPTPTPTPVTTPTATPTPSSGSGSTTKTGESVSVYKASALVFFSAAAFIGLAALRKRQHI